MEEQCNKNTIVSNLRQKVYSLERQITTLSEADERRKKEVGWRKKELREMKRKRKVLVLHEKTNSVRDKSCSKRKPPMQRD